MPITALILLFFSASMHALWNFLLKSSEEKYVAMGWQVILSGTLALGLMLFSGLPPQSMWLFAVVSMLLEALYFILLCIAYTDHDFSLVYPIARGAAPALLVLWSALFLREQLTVGGRKNSTQQQNLRMFPDPFREQPRKGSQDRDIFRLQGRHEQPLGRVFALAYLASC